MHILYDMLYIDDHDLTTKVQRPFQILSLILLALFINTFT